MVIITRWFGFVPLYETAQNVLNSGDQHTEIHEFPITLLTTFVQLKPSLLIITRWFIPPVSAVAQNIPNSAAQHTERHALLRTPLAAFCQFIPSALTFILSFKQTQNKPNSGDQHIPLFVSPCNWPDEFAFVQFNPSLLSMIFVVEEYVVAQNNPNSADQQILEKSIPVIILVVKVIPSLLTTLNSEPTAQNKPNSGDQQTEYKLILIEKLSLLQLYPLLLLILYPEFPTAKKIFSSLDQQTEV